MVPRTGAATAVKATSPSVRLGTTAVAECSAVATRSCSSQRTGGTHGYYLPLSFDLFWSHTCINHNTLATVLDIIGGTPGVAALSPELVPPAARNALEKISLTGAVRTLILVSSEKSRPKERRPPANKQLRPQAVTDTGRKDYVRR